MAWLGGLGGILVIIGIILAIVIGAVVSLALIAGVIVAIVLIVKKKKKATVGEAVAQDINAAVDEAKKEEAVEKTEE